MLRRDATRPGTLTRRAQFRTDFVTRDADDPTAPIKFGGHAAVFNERTWIGSWFEEQIADGAFKNSIENDDVRMLVNHNTDLALARNRAGNLRLSEDDVGLAVEADMVPTSYARDLAMLLEVPEGAERATLDQMSFAFEIVSEERSVIEEEGGGSHSLYTITEARLWEVSVVTFPAYTETDAGLRTLEHALDGRDGLTDDQRSLVLRAAYRGQPAPQFSEPAPAGQETPALESLERDRSASLALATRMKGMTL